MTGFQKLVKYCAIAFAIMIIVGIISGICSTVAIVVGFSRPDQDVLDDMKEYEITDTVKDIDIEAGASRVTIKQADKFSVSSNLKKVSVKNVGGRLQIVYKKSSSSWFGYNSGDGLIEITIPTEFEFDSVDIDAGAGTVDIDYLAAKSIDFSLGAGKITIDKLLVQTSAKISAGAGDLSVNGGEVNNLVLKIGAGNADMALKLTGQTKIESGVGNTKLDLLGDKKFYELDIEKGLGNVKVDGKKMFDGDKVGDGESKVSIECGIGNVSIRFREQ